MGLFVNILTLTACFAAMTYCYVLAKRIHAFRNMKDGVGALIEEMIRTTSDLQTVFSATQHNIDSQYTKIQDKIDEGIALSEYLSMIMQEFEEVSNNMQSLKTEIALAQNTQAQSRLSTQYARNHNHNHNIQQKKQSTLPDEFRLPLNIQQTQNSHFHQNTTHHDPLEDVVPADFDSLKRKRRPKIIIPGEEYL